MHPPARTRNDPGRFTKQEFPARDYLEDGKGELFEQFRVYLQGDRAGPSYATVAAQRGMSEGAVTVAVHRLRRRYGQLLREEIMRTVASPDEVDAELQHLIGVVGS